MTGLAETMELLARASSTSEVLTLNLTNLLILLVLKAIIFGFGLFSFGSTGRSSDVGRPLVTETEVEGGACFFMYMGKVDSKLECIKKVACEDKETAYGYQTAASMVAKMGKYFDMDLTNRHLNVIEAIKEGINHAEAGGNCQVYEYISQ